MNRIDFLKKETLNGNCRVMRTTFIDPQTISNGNGSLYIRRAQAIAWLFDNSPVYIHNKELIVGTRTLLSARKDNTEYNDVCNFGVTGVMPRYISDKDIDYFGFNEHNVTKTHYTADYGIVLNNGIGGIIESARKRLNEVLALLNKISKIYPQTVNIKSCFEPQSQVKIDNNILYKIRELKNSVEFLKSVIIVWNAVSRFILRYSRYAENLSKSETDATRAKELKQISKICENISVNKPDNFYEAVQLFWFAHLCVIIESQQLNNYGRVDVLLAPFLKDTPKELAKELLCCLFVKFYDQADIKYDYPGRYGGQITMTLGGVDKDGIDAVNDVTYMLIDAADIVRLPEPLIAFRINSKNPKSYIEKACKLSQSGLNTVALYNDDLFIDSLKGRDIPEHLANQYGFGLCQDITVPGYDDNSMWAVYSPIHFLFSHIFDNTSIKTFEEFYEGFKKMCENRIDRQLDDAFRTDEAFVRFRKGNCEQYFEKLKCGEITSHLNYRSIMSPLPLLSSLYHGCIETGADITLGACELKTHGHYLFTPVVTVNSLVAIKYAVFDKKLITMETLKQAMLNNFDGIEGEKVRQILLNSPKWGNDDDYADSISIDFLEFCLKTVQKHTNFEGGKMLAGIHSPHPVLEGKNFGATADGRKAFEPISVTMTPSSGTIKNGPLAALKSASKFNHKLVNWNFSFMLNLSANLFKANDNLMYDLVNSYFKMGGLQVQPNICNVEDLKAAQQNPQLYGDIIVRLWGISLRFVDMEKYIQDEVIERFS